MGGGFVVSKLAEHLMSEVRQAAADGADDLAETITMLATSVGPLVDIADVEALAEEFHAAKDWTTLVRLTDAVSASPVATVRIQRLLLRGLMESGAKHAAARVAADLVLDDAIELKERSELLGLIGRVKKDAYLETGSVEALDASFDAYQSGYDLGFDPLWHGVNIVALRRHSERPADAPPTADELLALARSQEDRDVWSWATEVELIAGAGAADGDATTAIEALMAHDGFSPQVSSSLQRQLRDLYGLAADAPAMLRMSEGTLAMLGSGRIDASEGVSIMLPASTGEYEKIFGDEHPVPLKIYAAGAERARSVAKVSYGGGGIGTAFVIDGAELHPDLAGQLALVTNEHVVAKPGVDGPGKHVSQVALEFELGPDGEPITVGGLRAVWFSVKEELDVCVMLSDDPALATMKPLAVAPRVPLALPGAYVYVIGHPGGAELKFSIRGNDYVDTDFVRLHYTAPTEKGSSGSPVFDLEWQLVGVHHKGLSEMQKIDGSGTYEANEGMTIEAIRKRMAEEPPTPSGIDG